MYEESEFNIDRLELRKLLLLKVKKILLGIFSRKKMVWFVDVLGLDLEDVRYVFNLENLLKILVLVMVDLKVGIELDRKEFGKRFLIFCF